MKKSYLVEKEINKKSAKGAFWAIVAFIVLFAVMIGRLALR